MNKITVAICAYNCEKYIEETLTSILNQTFQDFDLLIINDCSSDDTILLIEDYLKKNQREYRLINLEVNDGIANARHLALLEAKTKYILFIDSDDLPHTRLVEKEYKMISSDDDIIAVSSWLRYIDMQGNKLSGGFFLGAKSKEEFMSLASKEKLIFHK